MEPQKPLYHFTCAYHLPQILQDGYLKLTESNLRYPEKMYKPVVWLTTSEKYRRHGARKKRVRRQQKKK